MQRYHRQNTQDEMHNTFFTITLIILSSITAKAQFYTIVREPEKRMNINESELQTIESEQDEFEYKLSVDSVVPEFRETDEKRFEKLLNTKRNVRKRRSTRHRGQTQTPNIVAGLPELTIPNLVREIKQNGILHGEIVLAQAILETGWFTSNVCRNKNNLFGLTNPRTGKYYEFSHWTESVTAYYTKVQYRYKGGNYLRWLDRIGYAEAPDYIPALIRVIRQLRQMTT